MREFLCPDDVLRAEYFQNKLQRTQTTIDYSNNLLSLLRFKKQFYDSGWNIELIENGIKAQELELNGIARKGYVADLKRSATLIERLKLKNSVLTS